jgi:MFS transporter, FSR family, fosmidomycin resistance protein
MPAQNAHRSGARRSARACKAIKMTDRTPTARAGAKAAPSVAGPVSDTESAGAPSAAGTAFTVLAAISLCHFLNDMMQSLLPAIYPILKSNYGLDFGQVGLITFTFQFTASLLQPVIGNYTDRSPQPYSLSAGMGFTFLGLFLLSRAGSFGMLLVAAGLVGVGSAVLHPESSRVARMASGGRHGLAQALFQVGGNVGSSIGPLLAAFVVLRFGQSSVAWFSIAALLAMIVLFYVGNWYRAHGLARMRSQSIEDNARTRLPARRVAYALLVLVVLIFSKFFYIASMSSYYTFYLIDRFGVSVGHAQIMLFVFLASVALGTVLGGAIGDRFGRKAVIWASILGALPFTLLLPHVSLVWTGVLTVPIGMILASAFPAIVVYGQELLPARVGTVAGMFFGLAFGLGGLGAALLGQLADATSIHTVYEICSTLPLLGLLAWLLPDLHVGRRAAAANSARGEMH